VRHGAGGVDIVCLRVVHAGVFLRRQKNPLVVGIAQFERRDRFLPPDEQRDHHVREHDHVAQRQHGQRQGIGIGVAFGTLVRSVGHPG